MVRLPDGNRLVGPEDVASRFDSCVSERVGKLICDAGEGADFPIAVDSDSTDVDPPRTKRSWSWKILVSLKSGRSRIESIKFSNDAEHQLFPAFGITQL